MLVPIYQVDAFTRERFHGNPAAVVPLDGWLDDEVLQRIAAENNLSETAFFVAFDDDDDDDDTDEPDRAGADDVDFNLRWFTPTVEVDLCGHATLAAAHVLTRHRGWPSGTIRFRTRTSGIVIVRMEAGRLHLDFPSRPPTPMDDDPRVAAALGRAPSALLNARDYLCVYDTERDVAELEPNFEAICELDTHAVIVTAPADDEHVDFVSRFFAPRQGVPEDPVTGSAHCTLLPYWAERLGRPILEARQISERGGEISGRVDGDRVLIGGYAVTYLEGSIDIGTLEPTAV